MVHKSILILFVLALALTSSQASLAASNQEPIFSDDFESGNLLAWSSKKTGGYIYPGCASEPGMTT